MSERPDVEQLEAMSDEELRIFCYDTPAFESVYDLIGGDTLRDQIASWINDDEVPEDDSSVSLEFNAPSSPIEFTHPLQVFLCHSSRDKEPVRQLYHRLKADGLNPWLYEESLLPGQNWRHEIPKAVRSSDVVLVCLSNRSTTTEGVIRDEITFALDVVDQQPKDEIFIIPVRLENCQVPVPLDRWQWVDLFEDKGYERLLQSLKTIDESREKGIDLKGWLLKIVRDPMWQMIGVIVAILSLGWAIYVNNGNALDLGSTNATQTLPPTPSDVVTEPSKTDTIDHCNPFDLPELPKETTVLIEPLVGRKSQVLLSTLRFENQSGLRLASGKTVAFSKMKNFTLSNPRFTGDFDVDVEITLLDCTILSDRIQSESGSHLTAETEFGPLKLHVLKVKQVDFQTSEQLPYTPLPINTIDCNPFDLSRLPNKSIALIEPLVGTESRALLGELRYENQTGLRLASGITFAFDQMQDFTLSNPRFTGDFGVDVDITLLDCRILRDRILSESGSFLTGGTEFGPLELHILETKQVDFQTSEQPPTKPLYIPLPINTDDCDPLDLPELPDETVALIEPLVGTKTRSLLGELRYENQTGLPLASGITVAFNLMQNFTLSNSSKTGDSGVGVDITLLDCRILSDRISREASSLLTAETEFGPLNLHILEAKRIDFQDSSVDQATFTPTSTNTPTPTATNAPTSTPTDTRVPPTNTPHPIATNTPLPTDTPIPKPGATRVREKDGMVQVYVSAGSFMMGSATISSREYPVHEMTMDAYWIDRTEVTNAQYSLCVSAGQCNKPNNRTWNHEAKADHPVVDVSWNDANDYATWVGGRLPTEAEWEYACRGEEGYVYPWGDEWEAGRANTSQAGPDSTTPVGHYSPQGDSPYGVADMSGNVWEVVQTEYRDYPYQADDGREDLDGERRVIRGGAFSGNQDLTLCAVRVGNFPDLDFSSPIIGFRLVTPIF